MSHKQYLIYNIFQVSCATPSNCFFYLYPPRNDNTLIITLFSTPLNFVPLLDLHTNNDVVDRNEDQLYDVPNESHDGKSNGTSESDLFELPSIRFCAPLNKSLRVQDKFDEARYSPTDWIVLIAQERSKRGQLLYFLFEIGHFS